MINSILNGFMQFIISLIEIVMKPFDLLLQTYVPETSSILANIQAFFNYIENLIPWAVSYFGLSPEILTLVVTFITFRLTTTLIVHTVKFALKWYNALKL